MACLTCSRCQQGGHAAAACPKSFFKCCSFCKSAGHIKRTCPLRQAQAAARHAEWVANGRPMRKERKERKVDDWDTKSTSSASTTSTSATRTPAGVFVLTEQETREACKCQKCLRDITKIEEQVARGEKVDVKQLEKIQRRSEIEETFVMVKIRAGYTFLRYMSWRPYICTGTSLLHMSKR